MRILITGGFGFIGGRLGKNLDDAGHQVVLGARKLQESPTWLPNADVEVTSWTDSRLLGKAGIETPHTGDIREEVWF